MICTRCLLQLARHTRHTTRAFSHTPSTLTPTQPTHSPSDRPVAAAAATTAKQSHHHQIPSSVPAGTVLKGLNFFKNQPDPIARPDEDYPAWLWTVLSSSQNSSSSSSNPDGSAAADGDIFCKQTLGRPPPFFQSTFPLTLTSSQPRAKSSGAKPPKPCASRRCYTRRLWCRACPSIVKRAICPPATARWRGPSRLGV